MSQEYSEVSKDVRSIDDVINTDGPEAEEFEGGIDDVSFEENEFEDLEAEASEDILEGSEDNLDDIDQDTEREEALEADAAEPLEKLIPKDEDVFELKVDGKLEQVTWADLKANYSGKMAVQARFNEANTVKQKAEHQLKVAQQEKESLRTTIQDFNDCVKKGWYRDALTALSRLTGEDPDQAWRNFQDMQRTNLEKIQRLTPEDLERQRDREEAEYWRRQADREKEEAQNRHNTTNLQQELNMALEEKGYTFQEAQHAYNVLLDKQQKGWYNKASIEVSDVVEQVGELRLYNDIDTFVAAYLPEHKGNANLYWEALQDTKKYNIPAEAWKTLIKELGSEDATEQPKSKQAKNDLVRRNSSSRKRKQVVREEDYEDDENITIWDL